MMKDHRGETPNFIVSGGTLIHQPTGMEETLISNDYAALREAQLKLWDRIAERERENE
jgi:hypothetical protein